MFTHLGCLVAGALSLAAALLLPTGFAESQTVAPVVCYHIQYDSSGADGADSTTFPTRVALVGVGDSGSVVAEAADSLAFWRMFVDAAKGLHRGDSSALTDSGKFWRVFHREPYWHRVGDSLELWFSYGLSRIGLFLRPSRPDTLRGHAVFFSDAKFRHKPLPAARAIAARELCPTRR